MLRSGKKIAMVAAAAVAAIGLYGCGNSKSSSSSSDSGSKKVTIRFSWWGNDDRHKDTLKAIKDFEKKNPNIKVKAEYAGWDGYPEKVATQMSGGTEADLMQTNYDWYTTYSSDGDGYADLSKFKDIIDMSGFPKKLMKMGNLNGKQVGLVYGENSSVFFVNKTVYNKAGVTTYPKTWDEYADVAKKLGKGKYAMVIPNYFQVLTYMQQKTGKGMLSNSGKMQYTKKDFKDGFDWYQGLTDKGITSSYKWNLNTFGTSSLTSVKEFTNGTIAGSFDWNGNLATYATNLKQVNDEIAIPSYPTVEGAKTDGVMKKPSMCFSISKHSDAKKQKAAAKLLNFLMNNKTGVKDMGMSRGMPANTKAVKILEDAGKVDAVSKAAYEYGKKTTGIYQSPYIAIEAVQSAYNDVFEAFGTGSISSSEAASQMMTKIPAAVKQAKASQK
ncbi:ABC transporter substrate-binding protein [Lacticaseibacillus jixiensis]|uniref:ABC transporter substrate-binding protein n=1 Tax=Lacticaseibacillus jixiensis TaxID=3231926 RepID=UPI0036F4060C